MVFFQWGGKTVAIKKTSIKVDQGLWTRFKVSCKVKGLKMSGVMNGFIASWLVENEATETAPKIEIDPPLGAEEEQLLRKVLRKGALSSYYVIVKLDREHAMRSLLARGLLVRFKRNVLPSVEAQKLWKCLE